jgi:hypothetical protein
MEQWKDIPGFDGVYQISSIGRVRRAIDGCGGARAGQVLQPQTDRFGYVRHTLRLPSGRSKLVRPHVTVLEVFIGPRPSGFDASHKSGIRTDNSLENLCWESASANHRRKLEHGTLVHGEQHKCAKLTTEQALDIRDRISSGEVKAHLAREYGVSKTLIGWIGKRKAWPHASRMEAAA